MNFREIYILIKDLRWEIIVTEIKELLWQYFNKTGRIGSYLLLKELEHEPIESEKLGEDETNDPGVSFHTSNHLKAE